MDAARRNVAALSGGDYEREKAKPLRGEQSGGKLAHLTPQQYERAKAAFLADPNKPVAV